MSTDTSYTQLAWNTASYGATWVKDKVKETVSDSGQALVVGATGSVIGPILYTQAQKNPVTTAAVVVVSTAVIARQGINEAHEKLNEASKLTGGKYKTFYSHPSLLDNAKIGAKKVVQVAASHVPDRVTNLLPGVVNDFIKPSPQQEIMQLTNDAIKREIDYRAQNNLPKDDLHCPTCCPDFCRIC